MFESYEKRFFRTFEDAMQPPPSFRRSKIATKKPGFPMGWKGCFHEDKGQDAGRYRCCMCIYQIFVLYSVDLTIIHPL